MKTETNRRKLVNAFWSGSPVAGIFRSSAENEYLLLSSTSKALLVKEEQVTEKTTKTSSGASVFTLRKNGRVVSVRLVRGRTGRGWLRKRNTARRRFPPPERCLKTTTPS